jgi:hypothetical protein
LNPIVGGARLTSPPVDPQNGSEFAIRRWWEERLAGRQQSHVTFIALNRIAEFLLRTRPHILRALRITYPIVFLDEFRTPPTRNMIFFSLPFTARKPRSQRSAMTNNALWCGPARVRIRLRGSSRILARRAHH